MQTRFLALTFLLVLLTACVPATAIPAATPQPPDSAPTSTEVPIPATLVPTPFPTWPPFPVITPDAIQVAHWQEYQTELARCVLADGVGCTYSHPETALCEWDILGRSGQEVYVWAMCIDSIKTANRKPLVVYLEADGAIREVKFGGYKGPNANLELFPVDVQEKIGLYTGGSINPSRLEELGAHLTWREEHRDQPPLIVLSATPAP